MKKEPQMDADRRRWQINQITERTIGWAFTVGRGLGCGFLEKVYELRQSGLRVEQQYSIEVRYDGVVVGQYNR